MRDRPRGSVILTLDNGSVVQVLPDTQENSGVTWLHITVRRNDFTYEGWIIQTVVEMATPLPVWEPTATPTMTETITPIPQEDRPQRPRAAHGRPGHCRCSGVRILG